MTEAAIGYGSKFDLGDKVGKATAVYTSLGEVTDITPPSATVDQIDVTHMASPGGRREFIPGLIDSGECSFSLNYVPGSAGDVALLALLALPPASRARACRITYPNGHYDTFVGSLQSYAPALPTGDRMTAEITFKVSGAPTRNKP